MRWICPSFTNIIPQAWRAKSSETMIKIWLREHKLSLWLHFIQYCPNLCLCHHQTLSHFPSFFRHCPRTTHNCDPINDASYDVTPDICCCLVPPTMAPSTIALPTMVLPAIARLHCLWRHCLQRHCLQRHWPRLWWCHQEWPAYDSAFNNRAEKPVRLSIFYAFSPFFIFLLTNFHVAETAKSANRNISNPREDNKPSDASHLSEHLNTNRDCGKGGEIVHFFMHLLHFNFAT